MKGSAQDKARFIELEHRQALQKRKARMWSRIFAASAVFGLLMPVFAFHQWRLAYETRVLAARAAAEREFSQELADFEAQHRQLLEQFAGFFSNAPGTITASSSGDLVAFTDSSDSFIESEDIPNAVIVVARTDNRQTYELQSRIAGLEPVVIQFLPDSSRMAIQDVEGDLRIVDALTGNLLAITGFESPIRSFSVSADGQVLFIQQRNGQIVQMDSTTGEVFPVWQ